MDYDYEALVMLVLCCLLVFAVGVYFSGESLRSTDPEQLVLANRKIGSLLGAFTMTATWVGGGFINGTAEQIYRQGLISCQTTFAMSICISIGGVLFAEKMRNQGYMTMLDPIEQRYGHLSAMALSVLSCVSDVMYSAAIMLALGSTLSVILGLEEFYSICASALVVVVYTTLGGMKSVAVTDVVQVLLLVGGLTICLPFAYVSMKTTNELDGSDSNLSGSVDHVIRNWTATNENASFEGMPSRDWVGEWPTNSELPAYIDITLMVLLGGYAVQSYFQRVLSSTDSRTAIRLSHVGAASCLVLSSLPILVGVIATYTDWSATAYGYDQIQENDYHITLPLVLKYLTPKWISSLGLAAVSAAVMSSADSTFLGLAVVISRHIYTPVRNKFIRIYDSETKNTVSELEQLVVLRTCVPLVACLVVYVSLQVNSVYDLMLLCGDLNYVLLLPQLFLSVYVPVSTNGYGSLAAILFGIVTRLLCGEPKLGIPVNLYIGGYNCYTQLPFRTIIMLLTGLMLYLVSVTVEHVLRKLPERYDILNCLHRTRNTDRSPEKTAHIEESRI